MGQYDYVLGPIVLSIFINTYASGLVGFQYATYQGQKFKDPWNIKASVLALWAIDLTQAIIAISMIWIYCVENYVNPTALEQAELWMYTVIPLFNAISGAIVHPFLAGRISALTKGKAVFIVVSVLTAVSFVGGAGCGIYGITQHISIMDVVHNGAKYRRLLRIWLAVELVLNAIISGTLIHAFLRPDNKFMSDVKSPLLRIAAFVIQSGLMASVFSLAALIALMASPGTSTYIIFVLPMGRLYANTILGTLLARRKNVVHGEAALDSKDIDIWPGTQRRPAPSRNINLIRALTEQEIVVNPEGLQDERPTASHRGSAYDSARSGDPHKITMNSIPESREELTEVDDTKFAHPTAG